MNLAVIATAIVLAQSGPLIPTSDPGVARATLIDRAEIRMIRVEIQPGATRSIHTHDDVQYHVFTVVSGNIRFTMDGQEPVDGTAGKTFFMNKGTKHGFHNTGTTTAVAMEIFVRDPNVKPAAAAK